MNGNYLLTLDIGTTALKTTIFDRALVPLCAHTEEYRLLTPAPDCAELDPETYWEMAKKGVAAVLARSGIDPGIVKGIACTTQGETMTPVDKEGNPLDNAVIWLDNRAADESRFLNNLIDAAEFYSHTGLPEIGPACPVCKALWFKNNKPEVFRETHKFLLLEDLMIHRLTGRFLSNHSLMSSTGWYDINTARLWGGMLSAAGLPGSLFPEIMPCGTNAGMLTPQAARELGLTESVMVATGAMDQICSAIGAGNIVPGIVTETTGTALVIGATTEKPAFSHPLRPVYYSHFEKGRFLLLPYCPTAGIVLKWFKDEFCREEQEESVRSGRPVYDILCDKAAGVEPGCGGLIALPHFSGSYSPDMNPAARGVFCGIDLAKKKEHFVRAILESIAFMLRENIDLLAAAGVDTKEVRSIGGGAKSAVWNRIKADVTGKAVVTMANGESTSLGAAILGSVALGWYPDVSSACAAAPRIAHRYEPHRETSMRYEKPFARYRALYMSLKDFFGAQSP